MTTEIRQQPGQDDCDDAPDNDNGNHNHNHNCKPRVQFTPAGLIDADTLTRARRLVIARECRISLSYLTRILNGQASPSLQIAGRLSRHMGCTINDIAALKRPVRTG